MSDEPISNGVVLHYFIHPDDEVEANPVVVTGLINAITGERLTWESTIKGITERNNP